MPRFKKSMDINEQDTIIKMFQKQTIDLGNHSIDEKTINVLKRGDRYKLFKLDVIINMNDQDRVEVFYKMLDEMPDFEIQKILLKQCDKFFIKTLLQKPMFTTKEQLFKVLDIRECLMKNK